MKKVLSVVLAFVFVIGVCFSAPVTIKANAASADALSFYLNDDGKSYYVSDCETSVLGELVIPSTYNGKPITSIGACAFEYCAFLKSITIPGSVTSIGYNAFHNCSSLTSITIPDSVTNIADYAFYNTGYYNNSSNWENDVLYIGNYLIDAKTSNLDDFVIKSGIKCIADYAFYNCTSLTSVTIPDSVMSIGHGAFSGCSNLNAVYISDFASWCKIDFGNESANPLSYAKNLYLNNSLQKNLVIPEGITEIKPYTFYNCESIENLKLPKSLEKIGTDAFYYCSNISMVAISDLTAWCNIDFSNYSANPLYYAKKLYLNGTLVTDLVIPGGITEIKDYAFDGCTSLTSVTIPDSVMSIGYGAFSGCSNLNAVYISDLASWCNIGFGSNSANPLNNAANLFLNGNKVTNLVIPEDVIKIGDDAFLGCESLTSVTIPNSVTRIGDDAFWSCSNLNAVYISDLTSWCNIDFGSNSANPLNNATNLFLNGNKVTDLVIPEDVHKIGNYAFSGCGITSVTIPDSVTSIGDSAFWSCDSLTIITIPDSVTSIGDSVFSYCTSLTSITIPDSVTSIGDGAFQSCDSLTSITIPNSVASIGDHAFFYCTSLTSITIGDSVTSIGYGAFSYCTSLTSITIPDSVTSIGDWVFSNCVSLTSVTIPDSVTSIGSYTFFSCEFLTCVTIPDSVTSIGEGVFKYCESLTSVTIGEWVATIGDSAFEECNALRYVFFKSSSADWNKISIGSSNSKLTSSSIHYNTTEHSHSVAKNLPFFEGMEGSIEDICPVCGYVNHSEALVYANDYFAGVENKFVSVDEQSGVITIDASLVQDINDVIVLSNGYQLGFVPSLETGFYGTGSVVNVFDSDWNFIRSYVLSVQGDVTGDSVCDVLDCMLIELARNNHKELDGVYLSAGDLAENGVIDDEDFNAVVNKAIA